MISLFGDESSSSEQATYGLFAIADQHLRSLNLIVEEARRSLGATGAEPLHCRVLFNGHQRKKSAFSAASQADVMQACRKLLGQVASLNVAFYMGRVDRQSAPRVLHVPFSVPGAPEPTVQVLRTKLDLTHLQFFAYTGAATCASDRLPGPVTKFLVDKNDSVVRWFKENRRAHRLFELLGVSAELPNLPTAIPATDTEHIGLQLADVLTYFGTKALTNQIFKDAFEIIRPKSQLLHYEFADQVRRPFIAPPGVRTINANDLD